MHRIRRFFAADAPFHERPGQVPSQREARGDPTTGRCRTLGAPNVVIDADVKIPEGLVVGEDPELDAKRFLANGTRHLPHHPTHD